jgi:hypothetical protein
MWRARRSTLNAENERWGLASEHNNNNNNNTHNFNMTSILPTVPRVVMTILEPLSLWAKLLQPILRRPHTTSSIAGAVAPLIDCSFFVSSQLGHLKAHPLLDTEQVLSYQLANLYLLLALLGLLILNTTTEPRVVHVYVVALAIGDVGHFWGTSYMSGQAAFWDVGNYNAMMHGNVTAVIALFSVRVAYLFGLFGPDKIPVTAANKNR